MSIYDYQTPLPPSVKLVLDYRPIYSKLHAILNGSSYSSNYSHYSQEDFDLLLVDLLFSYFSLDRRGAHSALYEVLTAEHENPDYLEQMLADKALELIEEIDALTKLHIPHSSMSGDSPFRNSEIVDVTPLGSYRLVVEITQTYYTELKENQLVTHTTNRKTIPRT